MQTHLQEDIKREITTILSEMKDPRISENFITYKVEISIDGSGCRVYVSSIDGIENSKNIVKILKNAAGFVRGELSRRLPLKRSPEISFIATDATERAFDLMKKIEEKN